MFTMTEGLRPGTSHSVLVVDDDPSILALVESMLTRDGYTVRCAGSCAEARTSLAEARPDVALVDLRMPVEDGLTIIRQMAKSGTEEPATVMMSAAPDVETTIEAFRLGVAGYLRKPLRRIELLDAVQLALTQAGERRRRRNLEIDVAAFKRSREIRSSQIDSAISSLYMVWQPVVSARSRAVIAHEAFLRTKCAHFPTPLSLLSVAHQVERLHEVEFAAQQSVARRLALYPNTPLVFVNLHAETLLQPWLHAEDTPLGPYAERMFFEISEEVLVGDTNARREAVGRLRDRGFRIAIGKVGVQRANLANMVRIKAEVVKLEPGMISTVKTDRTTRRLAETVISFAHDEGIRVVVEGVEHPSEIEACLELGVDFLQGYALGRPQQLDEQIPAQLAS